MGQALSNKPLRPGGGPWFCGAGINAIYYVGDFPAYERIAIANREGRFSRPIYVGKAIPSGSRKVAFKIGNTAERSLYSRLQEHAETVGLTVDLSIDDFWCRVLVVDDLWIPMAEGMLISRFSPLWNSQIDGFGNHDPGKGRYQGARPR